MHDAKYRFSNIHQRPLLHITSNMPRHCHHCHSAPLCLPISTLGCQYARSLSLSTFGPPWLPISAHYFIRPLLFFFSFFGSLSLPKVPISAHHPILSSLPISAHHCQYARSLSLSTFGPPWLPISHYNHKSPSFSHLPFASHQRPSYCVIDRLYLISFYIRAQPFLINIATLSPASRRQLQYCLRC
jgi:hypothetical protein